MEYSMEMKGSGNVDLVDSFLNLPNGEDGEAPAYPCGADDVAEEGNFSGDNSTLSTTVGSCNSSLSGPEARCFFPGAAMAGEFCEPQLDLLAMLERQLTDYQEDSFSSEDLQKLQYISPSGIKSNTLSTNPIIKIEPISTAVKTEPTVIPTTIPSPSSSFSNRNSATDTSKARRKRSSTSRARNLTCWLSSSVLSPRPVGPKDSDSANPILVKKPFKQPKKKDPPMFVSSPPSAGRRCLHCETDKTPQWRTGPMGPKTLCNACGVRYKSGRLVPEYRPAASPTFVVSKHSNSHRKVLELRRQKEMHMQHLQHQQLLLHGASPVHAQHGDDYLIHNPIGPDFRQLI